MPVVKYINTRNTCGASGLRYVGNLYYARINERCSSPTSVVELIRCNYSLNFSVNTMGKFLAFVLLAVVCGAFVNAKKKGMLEIVTLHLPEECSAKAEVGDEVAVHYVGKLESGMVFDMSKLPDNSREPIRFQLGKNNVIKGWEEGVKGMCVGEHRKLVIPPHLGYGKQAQGSIPPDSTLIFTVELVELNKPSIFESLSLSTPFIIGPAIVVLIGLYLCWKASAISTQQAKVKREQKQKKKK